MGPVGEFSCNLALKGPVVRSPEKIDIPVVIDVRMEGSTEGIGTATRQTVEDGSSRRHDVVVEADVREEYFVDVDEELRYFVIFDHSIERNQGRLHRSIFQIVDFQRRDIALAAPHHEPLR